MSVNTRSTFLPESITSSASEAFVAATTSNPASRKYSATQSSNSSVSSTTSITAGDDTFEAHELAEDILMWTAAKLGTVGARSGY